MYHVFCGAIPILISGEPFAFGETYVEMSIYLLVLAAYFFVTQCIGPFKFFCVPTSLLLISTEATTIDKDPDPHVKKTGARAHSSPPYSEIGGNEDPSTT